MVRAAYNLKGENMKIVILAVGLIFSSSCLATAFGDSFQDIIVVDGMSETEDSWIRMDLEKQELIGSLDLTSGRPNLSLEPFKGESPDFKVELIRDFLKSGYDLLGGTVVSTNNIETFGTFAVVLNKTFSPGKAMQMETVYVEAMTGRQFNSVMNRTFK